MRAFLEKGLERTDRRFLGWLHFGKEVVRQMYAYRTEEVTAG
jgi:hypothetical protein